MVTRQTRDVDAGMPPVGLSALACTAIPWPPLAITMGWICSDVVAPKLPLVAVEARLSPGARLVPAAMVRIGPPVDETEPETAVKVTLTCAGSAAVTRKPKIADFNMGNTPKRDGPGVATGSRCAGSRS